jgi:mannosyltransferase OCH1-like enzyme
MQISQVFISDSSAPLPQTLQRYAISVTAPIPGATHKIYNNEEIRSLIRAQFTNEVLNAYDALAPYSYKADLARFCILHEIGGWYFDIGMRGADAQIKQLPDEVNMIAFRDINKYTLTNYACDGGIIFSKPKAPALATAIEMIVENVKRQFYGMTPLCPTGPSLWGKAIAKTGAERGIIFGDSIELTPTHQKKNKAMVLPDGTILAFKKPCGGGDLTELGASGTNNYNEIWLQRRVYLK